MAARTATGQSVEAGPGLRRKVLHLRRRPSARISAISLNLCCSSVRASSVRPRPVLDANVSATLSRLLVISSLPRGFP